jgi:pSer/pThr/pTyr-binding forkhead associated (FHA) protein
MMRSKAVSREHAVLWREQGKILIKDTMSRGGTFINGLRLSAENQESIPHVVRDGDMLTFGTSWRSEISEQRSVKVKVQLEGIPASAVPDVSK